MYAVCRSLPLTAVLAAAVSAHVVLENPKPFPFIDYGPTNPIAADGSDFPCKVPPGTALDLSAPATAMAIGEDQTLSFQGRAVHGGGSCQLALTKDQKPTKQSEWMVIHSIEGGCPARNQKGNLEGPNTDKYTFQIPAGIEPGSYVFSWTWNARIGGQPEYYMNCAPVKITAPPKAKRRQGPVDRREAAARTRRAAADFPPLFMANMGGGCTTGEALAQQMAIAYPDPGLSVERPEGDDLFSQPCDDNPRARSNDAAPRPTNKPADGNNEAAPAPAPSTSSAVAAPTTTTTTTKATATMTTSATTSAITTAVVSSASATTMMTTTTTAAPPASSTTTPAAVPPAETTTATSPTPAPPSPSGGGGGGGAEGGDSAASCSHGRLACFDGGKTAWSCTGSTWVKIADAPAGMQCSVGVGNGDNLVWKPVV